MNPLPKSLIVLGIALIGVGLFLQFGARYLPLGKLPGDIAIEQPGFKFYFPLATSILVSVVLTLVLWLVRTLRK